jgi:hypothetical protein
MPQLAWVAEIEHSWTGDKEKMLMWKLGYFKATDAIEKDFAMCCTGCCKASLVERLRKKR